jgi:hypothetical protein
MDVIQFKMTFHYRNRLMELPCSCFAARHFFNIPMFRIMMPRGKNQEDIYIFYDTPTEKHRFFWFPLPDPHQDIAVKLAKSLETFLLTTGSEVNTNLKNIH